MFDLDIINHVDLMGEIGYTFEETQIFLQRDGYDLVENINCFELQFMVYM